MKNNHICKYLLLISLLTASVFADETDDLFDNFDDSPIEKTQNSDNKEQVNNEDKMGSLTKGLSGKLTEQIAYSYKSDKPHDGISSVKTSVFLDYEFKFKNGIKFKANTKLYYDFIYNIKDENFSKDEIKELESEVELFDAYIEGSLRDDIDFKVGRQVVVWGRSDTIRITDILNPIDNRRPAMTDVEDLRLPVSMLKFDYFVKKWRITPIVIFEQRFSKNPPFGSAFNSIYDKPFVEKNYYDEKFALSVGGQFSGWDINFYYSNTKEEKGYLNTSTKIYEHNDAQMLGVALNILGGNWLFKTEFAQFDGLKYTVIQNKEFLRDDVLVGLEYNGLLDTIISLDSSLRHIEDYDKKLLREYIPIQEDTYQSAFRINSKFMNDVLTLNYLISIYGKDLDEGGFQRLWAKYEVGDGINANFGIVDYIAGSSFFNYIKDNDMIFMDISYSF